MDWQDTQRYSGFLGLSGHGFAWEFLRRNPAFRHAGLRFRIKQIGASVGSSYLYQSKRIRNDANRWGLLFFEDPCLDAQVAKVFWRPDFCAGVLPIVTSLDAGPASGRYLDLRRLRCRSSILPDDPLQHVLCADQGRFLQLSAIGANVAQPVQVLANVLPSMPYSETRWRSFKRLGDLVRYEVIRPALYPPDMGARRLARVLQALDGYLAKASQREIAVALFGAERVDADWSHPGAHLRDQVRRAIRRGRDLMNGGYLKLLR